MARDVDAETREDHDDAGNLPDPDDVRDDNFTEFERDLGRRTPNPRHGTPWIGTELDRSGESTPAYVGTGSIVAQDIGAGGFEVEAPADEDRDDLSAIATEVDDVSPADDFDTDDLNETPGVDGVEAELMTAEPYRESRVDMIDEKETPLDDRYPGEMGISSEVSELPIGAETASAGEAGRYECPNCGFEFDAVLGTRARCPACNYEADLSSYVGDEAFHFSVRAAELDD